MNLGVIIAAGGIGSRMGLGSSKQLLPLLGMPVLARTIAIFDGFAETREIVVTIDEHDIKRCRSDVVDAFCFGKVSGIVGGGASRAASVKNALAAIGGEIDTVLVHDGARPLLPVGVLEQTVGDFEAWATDGVVCGLPVTDTIKEVDPDRPLIVGTPDRDVLWAAQTPQIFRRDVLEKAYDVPADVLATATDDASLVERVGGSVMMTTGSRDNIKLTAPADLILAEAILLRRGEVSQ